MTLPCPECGKSHVVGETDAALATASPVPAAERASSGDSEYAPDTVTPVTLPAPEQDTQAPPPLPNLQPAAAPVLSATLIGEAPVVSDTAPAPDNSEHETQQFEFEKNPMFVQRRNRRKKFYALGIVAILVLLWIDSLWLWPVLWKNPGEMTARAGELLNEGKTDEAEDLLESVLSTFDDYAPARYLRGTIYQQKGRLDDAMREFEAIEQSVEPRLASKVHSGMALIEESRGNKKRAYELAVKAREESAVNSTAVEIIRRLKIEVTVPESQRAAFDKKAGQLALELAAATLNESRDAKVYAVALPGTEPGSMREMFYRKYIDRRDFNHYLRPALEGVAGVFSYLETPKMTKMHETAKDAAADTDFSVEGDAQHRTLTFYLENGEWVEQAPADAN